jgi:hypothetical protein
MFYNAMSIFVKKHYGGTRAKVFNLCIQLAIFIRGLYAAAAKFIKWIGLPVIDALLILSGFWLIKEVWVRFIRTEIQYSNELLWIAFPVFTIIYLVVAYYTGLYDRNYRETGIIRSTLIATIVLLAVYALLPEKYRFSRGIVVFGAILAFVLIYLLRKILITSNLLQPPPAKNNNPYILVAASEKEFQQLQHSFSQTLPADKIIGRVAISSMENTSVINLEKINTSAIALNAKELILCAGSLSFKKIISFIQLLEYKMCIRFHAFGSKSIVSSDSSEANGEVISSEVNFNLAQPSNKRLKRLVDFSSAILLLATAPFHILFIKKPVPFLKNCLSVLFAQKTWVGYTGTIKNLPKLRKPVLSIEKLSGNGISNGDQAGKKIIYWYLMDYEPLQDLKIILKNYKNLGASP